MKRIKRLTIATLLLPACYGVTIALWSLLHPFQNVPEGSFYFFAGMAGYFAFQWAFFRPMRTYVFGHELTHAIAAWLTGGEVRHFHVSKSGGSVTVSQTNFFVALAPYMVPLYSLALLILYYAVDYFYPLASFWRGILALLGMSLGFHIALTTFALKQDQPDLKPSGRLLSGVIIYLGNALSVVFLLGLLFPKTVSWTQFAAQTGRQTVIGVRKVGRVLTSIPPAWQRFSASIRPLPTGPASATPLQKASAPPTDPT